MNADEKLLLDITLASRAAVLREYDASSCIATTKVVCEVCRYYGITARAQAVSVAIWNAEGWKLAEQKVPLADWPYSAYSVGIVPGQHANPGRWPGHLVAVTDKYLIDGSIDQAARPKRGIKVGPMVAEIPDGVFPVADEALRHMREDGLVIIWRGLADLDWKTSPNWWRKKDTRNAIGLAIRIVKMRTTSSIPDASASRAPSAPERPRTV